MNIATSLERPFRGHSVRPAAPNPDGGSLEIEDTYSSGVKESADDARAQRGARARFAAATVTGAVPMVGLFPNMILLGNLEELDRTNAPGHISSVVGIAANLASFANFVMGNTWAGVGFAALSAGTTAFALHRYRETA